MGDRTYERLGHEIERFMYSPGFTDLANTTDFWHDPDGFFSQVDSVATLGEEVLENGVRTCLYTYQRTLYRGNSQDGDATLLETQSASLWIGVEDGYPYQWHLAKVNYQLTPPVISESQTTFLYPDTLVIQLPPEPL